MRPSFLAHSINGILLLVALIYMIQYNDSITNQQLIIITLLFSIAVGIHGITHYIEEIFYEFNPLQGNWCPKNNPIINFSANHQITL